MVLNTTNLDEPWYYENYNVYYGTKGQAKQLALVDVGLDAKTISGEEVTFLNIKVKRSKEQDIVEFEGEYIQRYKIKTKKRKKSIEELPIDKFCYVQNSRNYVGDSVLWWAKNGCGYTTDLSKAHKYSGEEIRKFNPRNTDVIWE